jgi:hypothetical protein
MDQRIIELINADIDRELDAAGRRELDAILQSSAEARQARAELLRLTNLLDNSPSVSVPQDLAARISRQVNLPSGSGGFSWRRLLSSFQPVPVAISFTAGLLLAVGYMGSGPGGNTQSPDVNEMVGTMVAGKSSHDMTRRGRMALNSHGLKGTITLHESGELYVLNFDLDSDEPVEVAIGLEGAGLSFGGVAKSGGIPDENLLVSGGTLRVVNQGKQSMTVFLQPLADTEVRGSNLQIDILPGPSLGEPEGLQG